MKGILGFFVFFCAFAHAGAPEPQAESALLKFHPSSQAPKVGEAYTLLIQVDSGFTKNEVVLETYIDGIRKDSLQSGAFLWAMELGAFGEVKDHLVLAKAFVRNERESSRIRTAIQALEGEISALEAQIAVEQDETRRDQLIVIRDRKLAYKM